ncbi:MAG: N-acetylneuraminate synthase [Candidatus Heimdallarchaeota archaeon]
MKEVLIGKTLVGKNHPTFVIAEAGVNHNGDLAIAKKMVDAAIESGANAIKFQTFKAENLAKKNAPKAAYQKNLTDKDETQYQMLKKLELSKDDTKKIFSYCEKKAIECFSTPYGIESAKILQELKTSAFKIGSGDTDNYPLLKMIAKLNTPIILSSGMSNLGEVEASIRWVRDGGCEDIILLHCVTSYPAKFEDVHLRVLKTFQQAFDVIIGFSDHTPGIAIPIAAVALGAKVIEKHFTLDKNLPGPDHKASLEPQELKAMIDGIRDVEASLGSPIKRLLPNEIPIKAVARKSITASVDIPKGMIITEEMLTVKRPGKGISPRYWEIVIGQQARIDIEKDQVIGWDMI